MSFPLVNLVNGKKCGGPYRRTLLLALAFHAKDNGSSIYPSVAVLARRAEMNERTVQRNLRAMVREGLLVLDGKKICPRGHTREYRLNIAALSALPDLMSGNSHSSGANHAQPTPGAASPVTPGTAPPVKPGAAPPVTSGAASPIARQDATQPCQGIGSAAAPADEWVPIILAAAGPGLADPEMNPCVRHDLVRCVAEWRSKLWDLEADILPVIRNNTSRPRARPLRKLSVLGEDIAVRHARRLSESREGYEPAIRVAGDSPKERRRTAEQKLQVLRYELFRLRSGVPFPEHRGKPPPGGWEAHFEREMAEIQEQLALTE